MRNDEGYLLILAAQLGKADTVSYLLSIDWNRHADDDRALISACESGQLETAKILLNAGVNPNQGLLPAIRHHKTGIVRLLIASGARINRSVQSEINALSAELQMEMGLIG